MVRKGAQERLTERTGRRVTRLPGSGRAHHRGRSRRVPNLRQVMVAVGGSVGIVGIVGVIVLAIVAAIIVGKSQSSGRPTLAAAMTPTTPQQLLASTNLPLRFAVLSQAHTDSCANLGNVPAIYAAMAHLLAGSFLQGSCCNPMNLQHYQAQIFGLRAYSSVARIPADPYNVPAALANNLLQDDRNIALTPAQLATFNQAASMTTDHGWCCCQCWAWYAHAGLAKYLIAAQHFSATQVAAVTNLEDCCGGA